MGSAVGVYTNKEVKDLTAEEREQLKEHITRRASAEIRRLINSDPTVLKHLTKHKGVRDALKKAAAPTLKRLPKKK